MEVTQSIRLVGKAEDVLRDATLLQDFLRSLPTALESAIDEADDQEWPIFADGLLEFRGSSVTVPDKLGRTLAPLLDAHGSVVKRTTFQQAVIDEGKKSNEALVRISRLRKLLLHEMPSITIESAGIGYRIAITD